MVEGINNFTLASSSKFKDKETDTDKVPPIVLYNRPKQFVMASPNDGFAKQTPEDKPIMLDVNDKFVQSSDENEEPKQLLGNAYGNVGAKFNPKAVKSFGEEALKWGRRIWTGLEIYDTLDGYRERFTKDKDKEIES